MTEKVQEKNTSGFTIVELIIVIVVIAILAAITIVSYNGVRERAVDAAIKSDLQTGATQLESDKVTNGTYPLTAAAVNNGQGLKASAGNTLTYNTTPYGYCLDITSGSRTYSIRSKASTITNGGCVAVVTTYAGSTTYGYLEGNGTAARFSLPMGVVIDSKGNMFVADRDNNRIRKITPAGDTSTFAGSGAGGTCIPGTGTAAVINIPNSIAIDSSDNLYITAGSNCIMKITPTQVVTMIGGGGGYGAANGASNVSQFKNPTATAVDDAGNVYVVDRGNFKIRVISPSNVTSDFAGSGVNATLNGTGTSAQFNYPSGIAYDRTSGVLYVSEDSHKIRKITIAGVNVQSFVGSTAGYADGTGASAQFSYPCNITTDWAGNLYVAEQDNSHRIRKVTSAGVVTTIAGNGTAGDTNGTGTAAQFYYPAGMGADSSGNLYVTSGAMIRKIEL